MKRNSIPLSAETLLQNLDSLVNSVNLKNLRTTVDELGKAFNGRGPDLGSLLDSNHDLLDAAEQNLPQTIALIEQSGGVLQTQLDLHDPIYSWAHNLEPAQRAAEEERSRHPAAARQRPVLAGRRAHVRPGQPHRPRASPSPISPRSGR